jgi:hypothetical protein
MDSEIGETAVAWQAIKVDPGSGVVFGGWFSWAGTGTVNMKVIEGYGPDGTVLGTTAVPTGNDWCFSSVEGFSSGHVVTIVWELVDFVDGHADTMTIEASICNDPFADVDLDGDVDHLDFALYQLCISGNGNPFPTGAGFDYCQCFDREGASGPDGDVDQGDFPFFDACYSGPNVPADVNCD